MDLDPQGQLAKVLGVESSSGAAGAIDLLLDEVLDEASLDRPSGPAEGIPRVASRIPGLDLVVGSKALGLYPLLEANPGDATGHLAKALDHAAGLAAYDFVLIDAPPSFGPLTLNVLRAAGEVVIPVPSPTWPWMAAPRCCARSTPSAPATGTPACASPWWCRPSTGAHASPTSSSTG